MITRTPLIQFLHRHAWQRVPRHIRRQVLVSASAKLAPRPALGVPAKTPIIVVGFLTAATGMGMSARLCYRTLKAAGLPVFGIDLTKSFRQDGTCEEFEFDDGRGHRGAGTLIIHINAPFMPLALLCLGRKLVEGKHIAGYWAWELLQVPQEWKSGLDCVHRVLVPSTFTQQALSMLKPVCPVDILVHPVAAVTQNTSNVGTQNSDPFVVLTVFNAASGFTRKNPLAAISAFLQSFESDPGAQLLLKAQNLDVYPEGAEELRNIAQAHANITLDERNISPVELNDMYASADVVLSLHRSEGFGLVLAEAMLMGKPVIATDWSGNQDFLDSQNGVPIGCRLVPARDPQYEYDDPSTNWAEPNIEEASSALTRLRSDHALCNRLGKRAAAFAAQKFSQERYVKTLMSVLQL